MVGAAKRGRSGRLVSGRDGRRHGIRGCMVVGVIAGARHSDEFTLKVADAKDEVWEGSP